MLFCLFRFLCTSGGKRIELSKAITGTALTLSKVQSALERAGVEFIPGDDSKGPGVRLKQAGEGASKGKSKRRKG